jgi:putative FmdB family regulatory protein
MPTYEFRCQKCGKDFEVAMSISEYEKKKKEGFTCEGCGSQEVVQQIAAFQVQTSKKS